MRLALKALVALLVTGSVHAAPFPLDAAGRLPTIVTDGATTTRLAGDLLGRDLLQLTGLAATPATTLTDCPQRCIVIGTADAPLVRQVARALAIDLAPLAGQTERYLRAAGTVDGRSILLIAGADRRGAVYGVVDATRELGVSAWEWWADVTPARRTNLTLDGTYRLSVAPTVTWRGIFINDEDWGLQPWAAKTFDPARDIGPRTYARVFELMWRLKANLIWPAMHPSTKAFHAIPGNAQVADDYAIVAGTSHAEPMMRNNVSEWKKSDGPFNFFTNRARMVDYWQQRVDDVKGHENLYTLGLRGVHDSALEGASSPAQARATVEEVIDVQRAMLGPRSPQIFTMYKEVLDYYNDGLKVPNDVTLVWPEDNYGYLNQLGTATERARSGGNGIYYHISYWGRPHDYLWLATTHPALIRDQLQRAVATGAQRLWVLNVGDIKPAEYLTQYFLDAAFDVNVLKNDPARHLAAWAAGQFGAAHADAIAAIQLEYYRLAWERRPEFMGWSQTEPTRPVRATEYVRTGGDEAERRLARYRQLVQRAEALEQRLPPALRDAYFQLVLYPVRASANLNTRILKLDLAAEYAKQGRPSPTLYTQQAKAAHAAIVADTARYNTQHGGKWAHLMDMAPRRLPVFAEPAYLTWPASARRGCGVIYPAPYSAESDRLVVPRGRASTRTITLVSYGEQAAAWSIGGQRGDLNAANGYEQRIALAFDGRATDNLTVQCGGQALNVNVQVQESTARERIIVLPAAQATAPDWEMQPGLGTSNGALRARLDLPPRSADTPGAPLIYRFLSDAGGGATLRFVAVPVHALTAEHSVRIDVRIDDGPLQTLDYTTVGRSEEWKQNVLSNTALRTLTLAQLTPGAHTIRVYARDPGVVLDRIDVVLDGAPAYYGLPPSD